MGVARLELVNPPKKHITTPIISPAIRNPTSEATIKPILLMSGMRRGQRVEKPFQLTGYFF
jgi:hypothetical protein